MSAPPTQAPTIAVTVTLFADLRRFVPRGAEGRLRYTLPAGSTIADLLATIGIPPDADVTAGLDGELARRETPLHEGAEVMLLSPMEGGRGRTADRGHVEKSARGNPVGGMAGRAAARGVNRRRRRGARHVEEARSAPRQADQ